MATPLIRGKRHSWASIRINTLGRTIDGVTKIQYDDNQVKENFYGAGPHPVGRGNGNFEPTCSITLYAYEIVELQRAIPTKRLQDIPPFDIVVSYIPEGQDELVTDIIRNVEFKTNGRDVSQGDTSIQHEFEMICSHINWGGTTVD